MKSITEVRKALPHYVKLQEPIVIIQNSQPQSILVPYEMITQVEEYMDHQEFLQLQSQAMTTTDDHDDVQNFNPEDIRPL